MFDLEQSIANWRRQMLAAGIKSPAPLEELENHLREEFERQMRSGLHPQRAFEMAACQIGQARTLKTEFKKMDAEIWIRPLAWSAWTLFAVSFFLPALGDGLGWRCAGLSATAVSWPDFWGNWTNIHLASLTLANLVMIVSPLLLSRFSHNRRFIRFLRVASIAALALVWSFLLLLITHDDGWELRIGCYLWAFSFLPLSLSVLKIPRRSMLPVKYV